ncbi:GreA/GreB family elongation factor [Stakelama marina]|uniref:GreA/GreB family elongation factor n=1 Tax=Stakelama marina TaxID=2826939 RepID=A0A8T4IFF3_9SPHN|nr:GreA/GreB family elongation factor [Stakelama marina]MBR0551785.1 GreA/GreB family elongation factor [Stakelama marina]
MSRAFVKEDSDAPPPPPLPRTVSDAPNRVTPRGLRLIEEEVARLEQQLAAADEEGRPLIERDLDYWRLRRNTAHVERPPEDASSVAFGTQVDLIRDGKPMTIRIVGEDEADPKTGDIAWTSPLVTAIEELKPGDTTEFEAGGRIQELEIVSVSAVDR